MKRLCILLLTAVFMLSSCSNAKDDRDISNDIFSDTEAAEALNGRWLFLPKDALIIRTTTNSDKLQVDFSGCEHTEITEYAKQIFQHLIKNSVAVYDVSKPFNIEKATEFKEAALDLNHAGTAYAYYYIKDDKVYLLVIKYYGCGSGKYGNGKSSVTITDETETMNYLLKE